jgi:MoaA/NifB/PqqE/SkfB family radical SAM enzyme
MPTTTSSPALRAREVIRAWGNILIGRPPVISIEITRECPLSCPGCYAYGDDHLGGAVNLRQLNDFRGDELVEGVVKLVRDNRSLHVSLVGGEPLVRVKELGRILPRLSALGAFTQVVTSGIVPIPKEWMAIPRFRLVVSIDGLPEHHNVRRKPATYERILKNIAGFPVNIHWTITAVMLERPGYLEEYIRYWSDREETNRILISTYTPQIGEQTPEMLTPEQRLSTARELARLCRIYPKMLMNGRIEEAFISPPKSPADCTFARMSLNYSADLKTRVEPCIFGGNPDCSSCGCAASVGLHGLKKVHLPLGFRVGHFVNTSVNIGAFFARLLQRPAAATARWRNLPPPPPKDKALIQIGS